MTRACDSQGGMVPAPDLREVAETRWDVDRDPVVAWSADATTWWLADPRDPTHRVGLLVLEAAAGEREPDDPAAIAMALAETVAACDFPPTDDHASRPRVLAALRAAGLGRLTARATTPGASS